MRNIRDTKKSQDSTLEYDFSINFNYYIFSVKHLQAYVRTYIRVSCFNGVNISSGCFVVSSFRYMGLKVTQINKKSFRKEDNRISKYIDEIIKKINKL